MAAEAAAKAAEAEVHEKDNAVADAKMAVAFQENFAAKQLRQDADAATGLAKQTADRKATAAEVRANVHGVIAVHATVAALL